jgi:hypothetical protein
LSICSMVIKREKRKTEWPHKPTLWKKDSMCEIWGFYGEDYEECRLLGDKISVRTSQQTHYVSGKVSSRLMLCTIWAFHGFDYEERCLLGHDIVWLLLEPTFRKNVSNSPWRWQKLVR